MSTTILCVGRSVRTAQGAFSSAELEAALEAERSSAILPYAGRKYNPENLSVMTGEGEQAADTLRKLLLPCEAAVTPLLNEIPVRPYRDTEKAYPLEHWLRKAAAQRRTGNPRQPESREAVRARADALLEEIRGRDCFLITYPLFLSELLDRLRVHGFVVQRTGIMKIQPLERFLVSRREEHCGGCQHNCFLSNPGCGVGREKAMRAGK